MEKNKLEEAVMLFRQLSPVNQKCFLMMVRTADIAEKNARKTYQKQDSILNEQEP